MYRVIISLFTLFVSIVLQAQQKPKIKLPIGVFDSGTGGLTILQAILTLDAFNNQTGALGSDGILDFEQESFQYLADQANMPYGNYAAVEKTALLKEHILKNAHFFLQNNYSTHQKNGWQLQHKPSVKMMVVACNTATAYAIEELKNELAKKGAIPVVGVIDAGVKAALAYQLRNEPGTIGIFATAGTVASDGYPKALRAMAAKNGMKQPVIISQGGIGLAESIDRDYSFFSDTAKLTRANYKGPSLNHSKYLIDTLLLKAYSFNTSNNKILCEYDDNGKCLTMQLNDPANYVRYHLVSLVEKMKNARDVLPLNTLILACTHYPYMKDTINAVFKELYNYAENGKYVYRKYLVEHVKLIDPGVETAKEVYLTLRNHRLNLLQPTKTAHQFFISVPNTLLKEIELQDDGWFTYNYKYGRKEGEQKEYVKYIPFDTLTIVPDAYKRFKLVLPEVYQLLKEAVHGLDYSDIRQKNGINAQ